MNSTKTSSVHVPVLLHAVMDYANPKPGDVVFDGTFGAGGYSRALAGLVGPTGRVIATDQDAAAVKRAAKLPSNVTLVHDSFRNLETVLGGQMLDAAVLDLGISSDQLADGQRGISFGSPDAPLDMRMNTDQDLTAWGILHSWSENELADLFYRYGGERNSRAIARAVVTARSNQAMETVGDLVAAVESVSGGRGRINPATKTFQALRIIVNDELGALEEFLHKLPVYMSAGSRVVIVSFHSDEDRIVKQRFKNWKQDNRGQIVTKKVVRPSREEILTNKRSRSAVLRCFEFN